MPCTSFIGDHTFFLLFIPPVIQCMVGKNIQQLKVTIKNNSWKSPDLLNHDLFAISAVSDSVHFLIHSSVFIEHCLSLFEPLIQKWHRHGLLHNRSVFLMVLEANSPRSKHQHIQCLVRDWVLVHNLLLVTSHGESGKRSLWGLFSVFSRVSIIRILMPKWGLCPQHPVTSQSLCLQIPSHWFSTCEFWGDTHSVYIWHLLCTMYYDYCSWGCNSEWNSFYL